MHKLLKVLFNRTLVLTYILLVASLGLMLKANAWSLKTHVWIAQQIINDILDDGMLTIGGRKYPVSQKLFRAVQNQPGLFLSGSLGPDVYPDPIVGQVTTHPGLTNGWKTDQWLAHILSTASKDGESALAYGFLTHAAGDMFAHTYVNQYAGDIFDLTDSERDVELRHFTLEKYIEAKTPVPTHLNGSMLDWKGALSVDAHFLSSSLIMNEQVAQQYLKSGRGLHLAAMFGVKVAIDGLDRETGKLISQLTSWGADYFKKQLDLSIDLATGKTALEALEVSIAAQKLALQAKEAVYAAALKVLSTAKDIVNRHPDLILYNESLLAIQITTAADLAATSVSVAADAQEKIHQLQNEVANLQDKLLGLACKVIGSIPLVGDIFSSGCDEIRKANSRINDLQNKISLQRQREDLARSAAEAARKAADATKALIENLKSELEQALRGLNDGIYDAAVKAAELDIKSQKAVINYSETAIAEAKKLLEKIKGKLDILDVIIDKIKALADRYNLITLFIKSWSDGINTGAEKFIEASFSAGNKMLIGEGNPLDDYRRWLGCYGSVFTGVPPVVGDLTCFAQDRLSDVKNMYNDLMASLPDILQWILNPTKQASDLAYKKIEPAYKIAQQQFLAFLSDPKTAQFVLTLTDPESINEDKLNKIFSEDKSGKNLLLFDKISLLINKDLGISDGLLNTKTFFPLAHSVTMAKLALLDPATLNQLIRDMSGDYVSPIFGATIYAGSPEHFSILFGVVQSIDGNHQWQPFALPYPKRVRNKKTPQYGYNYFQDKSKGLKIWIDPYLRDKVFSALFSGSVSGSLRDRVELKWPHYSFPECDYYQYPSTRDYKGDIQEDDLVCTKVSDPNYTQEPSNLSNKEAFAKRYHQCDETIYGDKHWTLIGSYYRRSDAEDYKEEIDRSFPDLEVQVWKPQGQNIYWTLMLGSCTTKVRAEEARNLAIRRKIAEDAYIWTPKIPFHEAIRRVANRDRNRFIQP